MNSDWYEDVDREYDDYVRGLVLEKYKGRFLVKVDSYYYSLVKQQDKFMFSEMMRDNNLNICPKEKVYEIQDVNKATQFSLDVERLRQ